MPRQTILVCDAPQCDEQGEECYIEIRGVRREVILGPKHEPQLQEIADWGRPAPGGAVPTPRAGRRRNTDEKRLLSLLDADKKES